MFTSLIRRPVIVAALAGLMSGSPAARAHGFDAGDAVITGLAIGGLVAASQHRDGYAHGYREERHWRPRVRYCPPRRSTVYTEVRDYGWGGGGYYSYGAPANPWNSWSSDRPYYPGGYQRRIEVNRW